MPRFYGKVGYVKAVESGLSKWEESVTERTYYGNFVRDSRHWEHQSDSVNDNITFNHTISIIADDYANKNLGFIKYVILRGVRVTVTSIEVQRPRIILTLGGLYNGPLPADP